MAVYATNELSEQLHSVLEQTSCSWLQVNTMDGLVLQASERPLEFVVMTKECLSEELIEEVVKGISYAQWLENKEALSTKIEVLYKLQREKLWKKAADYYFDVDKREKSLYYYNKCLSHYHEDEEHDRILANIGLLNVYQGKVTKGIELINQGYNINQKTEIYILLLRIRFEFGDIGVEELEDFTKTFIPKSDNEFGFLVWYYGMVEESEQAITCFMQIQNTRIKFHYVEYYMKYMIQSHLVSQMNSYLEPLFKEFGNDCIEVLLKSYMELSMYAYINDFCQNKRQLIGSEWECNGEFKELLSLLALYQSISLLKMEQIILSVQWINEVNTELLNLEQQKTYYSQLIQLSRYSKDVSKEYYYNTELIRLWKGFYRRLELANYL